MKDVKPNKPTIPNVKGSLHLRIIILILKIRLWVLRIRFKRILKISSANFSLFNLILKNVFLQKYKDKKIPYITNLSLVISTHYMHEKIPEEYLDFVQKEREIIDNEKSLVLENEDLKRIISDYHLIESFYHSSYFSSIFSSDRSKILSDECFEKSINYNKDVKPLTNESFRKKKIEIRNRLKNEKKKYRDNLSYLRSSRISAILPKIHYSFQFVTFVFTVISIMFLLTGYIYNKYFLGYYNIEVSYFFSSGDYLSTCIDKFYISGMSVFLTLISFVAGGYIGLRIIADEDIFDIKKNDKLKIINDRLSDITQIILVLFVTVVTVLHFCFDTITKYNNLKILIIFLIIYIYVWMLSKKILQKESVYVSMLILSASFFLVNISCELMTDIEKINRSKISDLKKYEFVFDREIKNDHKSLILLSANSGYFFFYDREKNIPVVIPKGSVEYIKLIQK